MAEDIELEKEEQGRQVDCISKAVKQLQEQKLRRDEYDDKRIKAHIGRAMTKLHSDLEPRFEEIRVQLRSLEEPIH